MYIALSLILASAPPALRTIEPAWEVIEVRGDEATVGEQRAPLSGSSRQLAGLLGGERAAIRLVRVDPSADGRAVARFLGRLHRLGARQLALSIREIADKPREGMLPYCPEADATCIGRPWAGVRPVHKLKPVVVIAKDGSLRLEKGGVAAPVKSAALDAALEGVPDTHLRVRAEGAPWSAVEEVLRVNPLPALILDDGRVRGGLGGALKGFDSILGGLELGDMEVGKKRDAQRTRVNRAVRTGDMAEIHVDVGTGQLKLDRAGPVKVEVSVDDDFKGEKLPAAFLRGVAKTLQEGTGKIDACYLGAKKKEPALTGQLSVLFRIGPGGKVATAKIQKDRLDSKSVKNCALSVIRSLQFPTLPKGRDGVVLTNTFVFE